MKKIVVTVALITLALPATTQAFSITDAIEAWKLYMRGQVATLEARVAELEAENARLRGGSVCPATQAVENNTEQKVTDDAKTTDAQRKADDLVEEFEDVAEGFDEEFSALIKTYEEAVSNLSGNGVSSSIVVGKKNALYQDLKTDVAELNAELLDKAKEYENRITMTTGLSVTLSDFEGYPLPAAPFDSYTQCFENIVGDWTCYKNNY